MKRTVTYTVFAVEGDLAETTPMGSARQSWLVGRVRARAVGDDGSNRDWGIDFNEPQPVIGSRFVEIVEIVEDES